MERSSSDEIVTRLTEEIEGELDINVKFELENEFYFNQFEQVQAAADEFITIYDEGMSLPKMLATRGIWRLGLQRVAGQEVSLGPCDNGFILRVDHHDPARRDVAVAQALAETFFYDQGVRIPTGDTMVLEVGDHTVSRRDFELSWVAECSDKLMILTPFQQHYRRLASRYLTQYSELEIHEDGTLVPCTGNS